MIAPVDPDMMRDRSDDDCDALPLLDRPASLRTGGDGDIIGRAAMTTGVYYANGRNPFVSLA